MRPSARTAIVAALVLAIVGCEQRRYPVEGTVRFEDGSPATTLAGGTVSLESVADQSNASGQIGPDGTFRVRDPLGRGGVPPGAYRVIILPPEGGDRRNPPVDRAYGRYETSGIQITVNSGPTKVTLTVRRPPGGKKS